MCKSIIISLRKTILQAGGLRLKIQSIGRRGYNLALHTPLIYFLRFAYLQNERRALVCCFALCLAAVLQSEVSSCSSSWRICSFPSGGDLTCLTQYNDRLDSCSLHLDNEKNCSVEPWHNWLWTLCCQMSLDILLIVRCH